MTAGTLCHLSQPGDRCDGDRQPQGVTECRASTEHGPAGMGRAGGKWAFPQAAAGSRGPELGASAQTQQGTPYRGILALGEVNEIGLLPPTLLLPLVEAICQDHAALALEESTLGRDSTSEQ